MEQGVQRLPRVELERTLSCGDGFNSVEGVVVSFGGTALTCREKRQFQNWARSHSSRQITSEQAQLPIKFRLGIMHGFELWYV